MPLSKTTIRNIDPDIFWDAKIYAAQTRQTVGEVVNAALERMFEHEEDHEDAVTDEQHG